ncbi:MAG: type II toxin-antitoxin system RelE/ParE family toxin [Thermodesulfobacteriota bacterium]
MTTVTTAEARKKLAENLPDTVTTKMKGNNSFHKIRSGDYRIIYEIHDDRLVVLVVKIGHRKDVYKDVRWTY